MSLWVESTSQIYENSMNQLRFDDLIYTLHAPSYEDLFENLICIFVGGPWNFSVNNIHNLLFCWIRKVIVLPYKLQKCLFTPNFFSRKYVRVTLKFHIKWLNKRVTLKNISPIIYKLNFKILSENVCLINLTYVIALNLVCYSNAINLFHDPTSKIIYYI
jgi:hypothetical protein